MTLLEDPSLGKLIGGMLIPTTLFPKNQTRSSTRIGYYDGFIEARPNFHLATGQHVIRLLLDQDEGTSRGEVSKLWANGVEVNPN